jgi:hypothetical protein
VHCTYKTENKYCMRFEVMVAVAMKMEADEPQQTVGTYLPNFMSSHASRQ